MQLIDESNLEGPFKAELTEAPSSSGCVRMHGEAQLADVKNANGRVYSESLWKRVMEDQRFRDRLESRKIVGELDHPADGRSKLERAAMVVTDMRLAPSKRYPGKTAVLMTYETLSTPMGKILKALHDDKVGLAVSSRGDGEVRRIRHPEYGEAQEVIPESFKFDTFDVVIDPSVDVDIRRIGESQVMAGAVRKILESEGSSLQESDVTYYQTLLESLQSVPNPGRKLQVESLQRMASEIERIPNPPIPIREDRMSAENTALETAQSAKLLDLENKLKAAESLVNQMKVNVSNFKMRAEHFEALYNSSQRELEENNNIILKMIEADEEAKPDDLPEYVELQTQHESLKKRYEAAESLVESLTGQLERRALDEHMASLTESLSPKQIEKVTPFLTKCESVEEMDKTMGELRGLLSVTESSSVVVRITDRNPIETVTEDRNPKSTTKESNTDPRLQESLKLAKALQESRKR